MKVNFLAAVTFTVLINTATVSLAQHPCPNRLADAIYLAEGGDKTRYPYGVMSVKVKDKKEARKVCINSIQRNYQRWEKAGYPGTFIDFMADRWCPPSVDPIGNRNWKKNVRYFYSK
ncbi:hypothetical protein [Caudoviricetes sp.]|nr:hypothetical protein [Caudoviricetes sp.]